MNSRSWIILEKQNPQWILPQDLQQQDPFQARDCGWVEQMLPFIEHYSDINDLVLDPFCGFASTLVATNHLNRQGVGYEICQDRVTIAKERLKRLQVINQEIIHGDLIHQPLSKMIDLCITNIPYFSCQWPENSSPNQLYNMQFYQDYLNKVGNYFKFIKSLLKPNKFCIVMVQNINIQDRMLPQAWDVAKVISQYFQLCEEKILLYSKPIHTLEKYNTSTDRSHEYALIFQHKVKSMNIEHCIKLLQNMAEKQFLFVVYGSFALFLQNKNLTHPPSDIDILIEQNEEKLNKLLLWFNHQGFSIQSWYQDVSLPIHLENYIDHYYFRLQQINHDGEQINIDITFRHDTINITRSIKQAVIINDIPVMTTS